ncbi:MAG: leucyl aminopeptidase [Alphaproteobacteria bacterium]|nr:MAG: leucyl aminopeptidase [Alphaproteobacteria bacterium]
MEVTFSTTELQGEGVLACYLDDDLAAFRLYDYMESKGDGQLSRAIEAAGFTAEYGEILDIVAPVGLSVQRLILIGTGPADQLNQKKWEHLGGELMSYCLTLPQGSLHVVANSPLSVAVGLSLRNYCFENYITKQSSKKPSLIETVTIHCDNPEEISQAYNVQRVIIEGVHLVRDLVNEPANELNPESFSQRMKEFESYDVQVKVLDELKLTALGMNAFLAVGQGSMYETNMTILEYDGTHGMNTFPPVVLLGKGITYDSGGLCLKSAEWLAMIKLDMGGAATVAGTILALAKARAPVKVIGLLALAENMPDAKAFRGGDIIKSMSGKTIEVVNTDAEGRLVLCDAMTYAQRVYNPEIMIDVATLTGSVIRFFGREYAGFLCNDTKLSQGLMAAGEATGEKIWPLPLDTIYDEEFKSPIADIKNYDVGMHQGSMITSGHFLHSFVEKGTKWAHIDIASTVCSERDRPLWKKGATGYGVRLLYDYIVNQSTEAKA